MKSKNRLVDQFVSSGTVAFPSPPEGCRGRDATPRPGDDTSRLSRQIRRRGGFALAGPGSVRGEGRGGAPGKGGAFATAGPRPVPPGMPRASRCVSEGAASPDRGKTGWRRAKQARRQSLKPVRRTQPGVGAREMRPEVTIAYCTRSDWLARATWMAQELLSSYEEQLGSVALVPQRARSSNPGGRRTGLGAGARRRFSRRGDAAAAGSGRHRSGSAPRGPGPVLRRERLAETASSSAAAGSPRARRRPATRGREGPYDGG